MKGVRVTGIHSQRLLAAYLGLERPAGPHVAKAGLMEFRGRIGA